MKSIFGCLILLSSSLETQMLIVVSLWAFIVVGMWLISSVFVGCLLFHPSASRNDTDTTKTKHKRIFNCLTIVTIIESCIQSSFYLSFIIYDFHAYYPSKRFDYNNSYCDSYNFVTDSAYTLGAVWGFLFVLQYILLINVYYYRLIIIFKGSIFELSKRQKDWFKLCCAFYLLNCLCCILGAIFAQLEGTYLFVSVLPMLICYISESIYLFYLLKCKLIALIETQIEMRKSRKAVSVWIDNNEKKVTIPNNGDNVQSPSSRMTLQVRSLFDVLKKYTILMVISLGFTILLCLILMPVTELFVERSKIADCIHITFVLFDAIANLFCIMVQFPIFDAVFKVCCSKCDNCLTEKFAAHISMKAQILRIRTSSQ